MELSKKAAYLQGLVDGLGVDESTKEGKIIKAMSAHCWRRWPRPWRAWTRIFPAHTTRSTT